MQISVCRKCTVFQNSALYYAAILKFENYAFVSPSELFKLKLILIVYAKKTELEITFRCRDYD